MLTAATLFAFVLTFTAVRRRLYTEFDLISQIVLALAGTVAAIVASGAFAACLERFSKKAFVILLGAYVCALLLLLLWCNWRAPGGRAIGSARWHSVVVIALVGAFYLPPSQIVIGGQDPSLYVAAARTLADSRKVFADSWSHRLLTEEERTELLGLSRDPNFRNWQYNGVSLKNDGSGRMELYMARGPSYLLAFAFLFGDLEKAFYSNIIYCVLAIFLFYLFARRMLDRRWALAAAALLAFCPAEMWFGRATYSEISSQFFIFYSLYHVLLLEDTALSRKRLLYFAIAVAAAAGAAMMRVDQAILLFLLLLAAPWALPENRFGAFVLQAAGVAFLALVKVELDATGPLYAFAMERKLFFYGMLPLWGAGCAAVSLLWYPAAVRDRLKALYNRAAEAVFSERGIMVISVLLIAFLAWGFVIRDLLFAKELYGPEMNHNAGVRTMNETIFPRLAILCGPPVFILSFWGIIAYAKEKHLQVGVCLLLVLWAAYGSRLFFQQENSPMLYWASRRYLPVIVPGTILFGCFALSRLRIFRSPGVNGGFAAMLAGLSLIPMGIANSAMLWRGEMNGMLNIVEQLQQELDPADSILISDSSNRHYNFTLRFLGGYQLVQIPELDSYGDPAARLLPPMIERLKGAGHTVALLAKAPDAPQFGAEAAGEVRSISASFSRLGENLDRFPMTRHTSHHIRYYQVQ